MPEYKPKTPAVVDISKVDGSPHPRKIGFSTDKSRYKTSKQTMGDPLINYEGKSNPYIDYQSIDLSYRYNIQDLKVMMKCVFMLWVR